MENIPPESYPEEISIFQTFRERMKGYTVASRRISCKCKYICTKIPSSSGSGQHFHSFIRSISYPGISRSSPPAELTVMSAPQILTPPLPTAIIRGHLLYLSCKVDGNPSPTVAWYKELTAPRPGQQPAPIEPSYHVTLSNGVRG